MADQALNALVLMLSMKKLAEHPRRNLATPSVNGIKPKSLKEPFAALDELLEALEDPATDAVNHRAFHKWNELPGEVKNFIYAYALSLDTPVCISSCRTRGVYDGFTIYRDFANDREIADEAPRITAYLATGLLLTNKKTCLECRPFLYSHNNIHFLDANALYIFMRRMQGRKPLRVLQRITFGAWDYQSQKTWDLLALYCPNLKTITIDTKALCACMEYTDRAEQVFSRFGGSQWVRRQGKTEEDRLAAIRRVFMLDADAVEVFHSSVNRFCQQIIVPALGAGAGSTEDKHAQQHKQLTDAFLDEYWNYCVDTLRLVPLFR
ncbi:hypothetical protein MPH_00233 [Macrophomina phaseolina MS6]|uniref:Uncharacterized protein n=1 Tax=Macrophomina phaseolina (strain MS6) TaxID=1126212 RepID=K2S6E6_MACPH|nr:hypothetical protein MPH_00233 [Macrophomina phaseolina MS6]